MSFSLWTQQPVAHSDRLNDWLVRRDRTDGRQVFPGEGHRS